MNRLQQLRQARAALVAEANQAADAALSAAQAEGRGLNEAELASQADFDNRLASLDAQIALAERQVEREASLGEVPQALDAGPVATRAVVQVAAPNISRDPNRGFGNLGEFALAVRRALRPGGSAIVDRRLVEGGLLAAAFAAPTNYHRETDTAEGAMVPPAMSQAIWQLVFNDPILDLLTVEPTSSSAIPIIGDETTPWGASGVQAKWRAEAGQMEPSKLDTKTKLVKLHELYAFVLATDELLEDAPRLTDRLQTKAPAAIRWKFVEALMWGTGAGQPLGWAVDNYAGKVSVSRANASQFAPIDAAKMFSRLLVQDGPDRSFWAVNRDTLPELVARMTVGNVPVWLPLSAGIQGAPGGSLLGRPIFFTEHCQTLGTAGDVQLVNPDGYHAAQRGPARQDSSIHLYFDYAITAFRWMFRFGGAPLLDAAVSAAKGSNSKSHFVVLS